jgi:hypothetical protein
VAGGAFNLGDLLSGGAVVGCAQEGGAGQHRGRELAPPGSVLGKALEAGWRGGTDLCLHHSAIRASASARGVHTRTPDSAPVPVSPARAEPAGGRFAWRRPRLPKPWSGTSSRGGQPSAPRATASTPRGAGRRSPPLATSATYRLSAGYWFRGIVPWRLYLRWSCGVGADLRVRPHHRCAEGAHTGAPLRRWSCGCRGGPTCPPSYRCAEGAHTGAPLRRWSCGCRADLRVRPHTGEDLRARPHPSHRCAEGAHTGAPYVVGHAVVGADLRVRPHTGAQRRTHRCAEGAHTGAPLRRWSCGGRGGPTCPPSHRGGPTCPPSPSHRCAEGAHTGAPYLIRHHENSSGVSLISRFSGS